MKNQKGFIQIPLLIAIIAGVLVLGGVGYFGVKQYQSYQARKVEKEMIVMEQKQKEDEAAKAQEDAKTAEVENLKKEVEALKNKKPEIIQKTIIKEVPASKPDLTAIIKQWRPVISYIECDFLWSNGEHRLTQGGSGTLFKFSDGSIQLLTNKHVVLNEGKYPPSFCRSKFLEDSNIFTYKGIGEASSGTSPDIFENSTSILDFATLKIRFPDEYVNRFSLLATQNICPNKASIGDPLIILGFPGIGSKTDITATEGIISGYDGDYYITSAKVEHGNSGGAAVSIKDNCYLGIPTFVRVGEVESLARILNAQAIWR